MNTNWLEDCIMYQIHPLGLCGAPLENQWDWSNTWNGAAIPVRRIDRLLNWIEHLKKLNITAVMFNPPFQSDSHGYNTRDYYTVDSRLGSNEDFAYICQKLHENKIRVVFDSVFCHVGRGFWAFRDLLEKKEKSQFAGWFKDVDFSSDNEFNDGFSYGRVEGVPDFVLLNLENVDLRNHIFGAIRKWVELYHIDGLRIDGAYRMPLEFMEKLRAFTNNINAGLGGRIAFIGDIINSPDYSVLVNENCLHSALNYECFKGVYSSLNARNLFDISFSLNRQYGDEGIYRNIPLMTFLDNHDVTRFHSMIEDKNYLKIGYGFLFSIPGYPCLYYGSEWNTDGVKENGDQNLRPAFELPQWNEMTEFIARASKSRRENPALRFGDYRQIYLTDSQIVFCRESCGRSVIVAINLSYNDYVIEPREGSGNGSFCGIYGNYEDMLTGIKYTFSGSLKLPPCSVMYLDRQSQNFV